MASRKNDLMLEKTVEGPLNYYDGHRACGTAADKGLAARLGGHCYNIVNNADKDEIYFKDMRHDDHFLDKKGRHTIHMFGDRRRKFAIDERNLVGNCMRAPDCHPREDALAQRRLELQLAQMENPQSYGQFNERIQAHVHPPGAKKKFHVHNQKYANEVDKLRPRREEKAAWLSRRGEPMTRSTSAPSIAVTEPHVSLARAIHTDARKEASQRQTESAHFAPWNAANSYAQTMETHPVGRRHFSEQKLCSVNRLENHDSHITRKNNHYSSIDKLTRSDPFFMRPRHSITNNSVIRYRQQ